MRRFLLAYLLGRMSTVGFQHRPSAGDDATWYGVVYVHEMSNGHEVLAVSDKYAPPPLVNVLNIHNKDGRIRGYSLLDTSRHQK